MTGSFKHRHHLRTALDITADISLVIIGVTMAAYWRGLRPDIDLPLIIVCAAALALATLMTNTRLGRYRRADQHSGMSFPGHAALSLAVAVACAYAIFLVMQSSDNGSQLLTLPAVTTAFGMLVHRIGVSHSGTAGVPARRVLVLGVGDRALAVRHALDDSEKDVTIVGHYPGASAEPAAVPIECVLPGTRGLTETARALRIDEIVVALSERRGGAMPLRELLDCRLAGIKVIDLASHFEQTLGQIRLDSLHAGWLIFGNGFRQDTLRSAAKRLYDISTALVLLIVTLPVMLVAALLIALTSGLPVFYRQERVGLNGRLFNVLKFRSMRTDAEPDGTPRWALADDARVTRLGRFMRKTHIDELPQLLNVLRGDMGMVGPRPERPYFVAQLTRDIPFYAVRHSVKPGVTGWVQVRFPYGASVADSAGKLQYDLYYVKNNSLVLDTLVLLETVMVVLTGKGAR
jgi:sugar transferase (PEP-CTERM system associated)